jgi:hypothetical protein
VFSSVGGIAIVPLFDLHLGPEFCGGEHDMSEPVGSELGDAICEFLTSFYSKEQVGKSKASARKHGITLEEAAAEALTKLVLERFEVAPKVKAEPRQRAAKEPAKSKVMKVNLWLRVENNSKFVRGKKMAREAIEQFVLSRYGMEKEREDGCEYTLTIPYETDEELDSIIYEDILGEANRIADMRNCFIEGDATSLDDPERSW